jgi:hypothetical protein
MPYLSYAEKVQEAEEKRAKLTRYLEPFNRPTPTPFPDEDGTQYENRVLSILQDCVPGYEPDKIKVRDFYRDNRELVVNQIYDVAAKEAYRPTKIPDGELRQVTRRDAAGRPSYEYFGSPKTWMRQFMPDTIKKLASIKTETGRGYHIPKLFG